jgi:hypothetical protein
MAPYESASRLLLRLHNNKKPKKALQNISVDLPESCFPAFQQQTTETVSFPLSCSTVKYYDVW